MPRSVRLTAACPRRALVLLAGTLTLSARAAFAAPGVAAADSAPPAPSTAPPPPAAHPNGQAAGPRLLGAAVAARTVRGDREARPTDARAALQRQERRHHGPAVALMIVGASAVVLGILVGDDAQTPLVVGGAVVGLIGLYRYLL